MTRRFTVILLALAALCSAVAMGNRPSSSELRWKGISLTVTSAWSVAERANEHITISTQDGQRLVLGYVAASDAPLESIVSALHSDLQGRPGYQLERFEALATPAGRGVLHSFVLGTRKQSVMQLWVRDGRQARDVVLTWTGQPAQRSDALRVLQALQLTPIS